MQKRTEGFTLIELMIVVAIIGILAAISASAYQNYSIRSRVSEGMGFASSAKSIISENAASAAADLSIGWNAPAATANVNFVTITPANGTITINYTVAAGNGTITFIPSSGGAALAAGVIPTQSIDWDCTGGTIIDVYRPANCR